MKVHFICGYYSELANKLVRRTEDYWDAYFYVWGVKVGSFKRPFNIHTATGKIAITQANFGVARQLFGLFIADRIVSEGADENTLLVPVPSKDGLVGSSNSRSVRMLVESMAETRFARSPFEAIQLTAKLPRAHEGGARKRGDILPFFHVNPSVRGRNVILVDDLLSTGGSLLASRDALIQAGANVLAAVTCGKTIYDFNTRAFGCQAIELNEELADFGKVATT